MYVYTLRLCWRVNCMNAIAAHYWKRNLQDLQNHTSMDLFFLERRLLIQENNDNYELISTNSLDVKQIGGKRKIACTG